MAEWKAGVRSAQLAGGQPEMFPIELTGILPEQPGGAHIEFVAEAAGGHYFCKRDKNGSPIRATEWFCTSLAQHLGIPVPDFAQILNPENGEVLFGSKRSWGTAAGFEAKAFLTTPQIYDKAVGGERPWIGSYLSRLFVLDLFLANPDRQHCNFLLVPGSGVRSLLAFDFASADLRQLGNTNFPIAQSQTMFVGRQLRGLHGFDHSSAREMLDWIVSVSESFVSNVVATMPDDWLSEQEKGKISGIWSDGTVGHRVAALRSGIEDGTLL